MSVYNQDFYRAQVAESRVSAAHVLPVLFQHYRPASVIDVGCGCGAWLSEFKRLGVRDLIGLDGGDVDQGQLLIEPHEFVATDLNGELNLLPSRRFDLAVSLEVAEHLEPARAADFIAYLAGLSDVVLFSAALPYQGGTAHLNENWLEYWALLFRHHDYHPVDLIRPAVWDNESVCWWYRQNIMIFARRALAEGVFGRSVGVPPRPLSLVHPEFLASAYQRGRRGGERLMWQDIQNFRKLGGAYGDPAASAPPEDLLHYRDTHVVSFDGLRYRIRALMARFGVSWGG